MKLLKKYELLVCIVRKARNIDFFKLQQQFRFWLCSRHIGRNALMDNMMIIHWESDAIQPCLIGTVGYWSAVWLKNNFFDYVYRYLYYINVTNKNNKIPGTYFLTNDKIESVSIAIAMSGIKKYGVLLYYFQQQQKHHVYYFNFNFISW